MLISKKWLEQYLPEGFGLSDEELQERISVSLAEVEEIKDMGAELKNIVTGEIKEIKSLPKSSKLKLVTVDTGTSRKRTILCAATNISEGAIVPVALPGGTILNPKQEIGEQTPIVIKEAVIAKVKSQGMLCSQKELGVSDDHTGIWILPDEVEVGEDFVKLLQDTILEIENKSLTHRPDCFSHVGIAREISAIVKTLFDYKETEETLVPTKTLPLVVKVEDNKLCKRYTAISIQGVKIKKSPLWLQLRLLACGIRPINNIVDATNFVMLDLGQPLHAFDYNKLKTPRIIVRTAKVSEKITTLDDEERELGNTHLLICDPSSPVGIAGVMGGKNSEIDKRTTDIVIESANFEMYNIRRTSQELGLRSEASTRFEKGLDPNLTLPALRRVVQLIIEIAGGEIASELIDLYPTEETEKEIEFETTDVPRLLGIDITKEEIITVLDSLQLEIVSPEASATRIKTKIPTFRRDLNIKEDILEEIGRIYGYDKFTPTLPQHDLKSAKQNQRREFEKQAKLLLSALGFDEIYTYSFTGEDQYQKTLLQIGDCLKLKNPVSPDLSYMRTSIVPSLLEKVAPNLVKFDEISIYESSKVYLKQKDEQGLPQQPKHITGLMSKDIPEEDLFLKLKGKIQEFLNKINIENIKFEKGSEEKYLHPKQQAKIRSGNTQIGLLGLLHPRVRKNWEIKQNTVLFTLYFDKLFELIRPQREYTKISKYPVVKRDLSFWIDEKQEASNILETLFGSRTTFITNIEIIDIFKDNKQRTRKSIAVKITLQSKKGTLTEDQINADVNKLMRAIEKMGGKVRRR